MSERNESTIDRVVRLGLGALLLGVAMRSASVRRRPVVGGLVGAGAAILLITGITGTCGVYRAAGISTYRA